MAFLYFQIQKSIDQNLSRYGPVRSKAKVIVSRVRRVEILATAARNIHSGTSTMGEGFLANFLRFFLYSVFGFFARTATTYTHIFVPPVFSSNDKPLSTKIS